MLALVVVAIVFFVLGAAAFAGGAIYYTRAKVVHANAEELNATVLLNHENAIAEQRRAEHLLARIQEHAVL